MNTRWTLRVVNARRAHHAWSKQHVLHTIFALVIASIITLPSSAFAEELSHNALAAAAVQAAVQTTVQTASANQASQVVKTPTAQTPAVQSPASQVVQAPQASVTPATPTATPAATPAAADVQTSVTEASDAKESAAQTPAASVPEAALAPDSATQTPTASAAKNPDPATQTPDPATQAQTQASAAPALDPEKYQDSLGTTLEFDWDKNGSTSKEDWLAFRKWLADYTPVKDGGNAEGGNTAMGAINIRVNKPEEGTKTLLPGVDVSKVKHYYLANVGQLTPSRYQNPWGTCWAHAIMGELESAMLKKDAGEKGQVIDESKHAEPKLTGIESKYDFSELYLALKAYTRQSQGAQKGEGVVPLDAKTGKEAPTTASLNSGGFTDYDETLLTNWDNVVTEKVKPYWPSNVSFTKENRLKVLAGMLNVEDESHEHWDLSLKEAKPQVPVHVEGVHYLPAVNHYAIENKQMLWKSRNPQAMLRMKEALVKYGALQVSLNMLGDSVQYDDQNSTEQNHAVLIVGWNDDYPADGFGDTVAPGKGAWLVKNSWGSRDYYANQVKQLQKDYHLTDEECLKELVHTMDTPDNKQETKEEYERLKRRLTREVSEASAKDPASLSEEDKEELEQNKKDLQECEKLLADYDNTWKDYLQRHAKSCLNGTMKDGWGLVDGKDNSTGHFWVSYYDKSYAGAQAMSVDVPSDGFDYDNNYSYNYTYAATTSPFALRTRDTSTLVTNVFTARGTEVLKAVSVRSTQAASQVNVKVYLVTDDDLKDFDPTNDGQLVSEVNYTTQAAGFETVKLTNPVQLKPGMKFAVCENVTADVLEGTKYVKNAWLNLETGLSQTAQDPNNGKLTQEGTSSRGLPMQYIWTYVKSNPGETFVRLKTKDGEKWLTPDELSHALCQGDAFEFGNALIKAFTVNGLLPEPPAPLGFPVASMYLSNDNKDPESDFALDLDVDSALAGTFDPALDPALDPTPASARGALEEVSASSPLQTRSKTLVASLLSGKNPDSELKEVASQLLDTLSLANTQLPEDDATSTYVSSLLSCSRALGRAQKLLGSVVAELNFAAEQGDALDVQDKEFMQQRLAYVKMLLKYYTLVLNKKHDSEDGVRLRKALVQLARLVGNKKDAQAYVEHLRTRGFVASE